jgi:hypothetical protein
VKLCLKTALRVYPRGELISGNFTTKSDLKAPFASNLQNRFRWKFSGYFFGFLKFEELFSPEIFFTFTKFPVKLTVDLFF